MLYEGGPTSWTTLVEHFIAAYYQGHGHNPEDFFAVLAVVVVPEEPEEQDPVVG